MKAWTRRDLTKAWTRRDLTIVSLSPEDCIVIACDSCGAVGNKKGDVLALAPRYVGKFATRVALTELMCSGAEPIVITNGVACEMQPTGESILAGIKDELNNADITDIIVTGSTEENFTTIMTALTITAIGAAKKNDLKFANAQMGDKLILLGSPAVGDEVDLQSKGFYTEIRQLLKMPLVREIVPIGSKGVAYEANTLLGLSDVRCKLKLKLYESGINYSKSAGPATCVLILCDNAVVDHVLAQCQPTVLIAEVQ